jgi:hypothetical protein
LGACSADHGRAARSAKVTTTTPATSLPREQCTTRTRFGLDGVKNEIRGASHDATIWGLALGPGHIPPRAGDELKIVWRITGTGPLHVTIAAPDGTTRPLVFGPEPHTGASTYHRPGDEWGTGIRFDTTGCWHLHLARANATGDVWLDVTD